MTDHATRAAEDRALAERCPFHAAPPHSLCVFGNELTGRTEQGTCFVRRAIADRVAAVATEARAAGRREAMEEACRAVCAACAGKIPSQVVEPHRCEFTWRHAYVRPCAATEWCNASAIRALSPAETPAAPAQRIAHSKSEFKRLTAMGVDVAPAAPASEDDADCAAAEAAIAAEESTAIPWDEAKARLAASEPAAEAWASDDVHYCDRSAQGDVHFACGTHTTIAWGGKEGPCEHVIRSEGDVLYTNVRELATCDACLTASRTPAAVTITGEASRDALGPFVVLNCGDRRLTIELRDDMTRCVRGAKQYDTESVAAAVDLDGHLAWLMGGGE